jgi:hypothetical protein
MRVPLSLRYCGKIMYVPHTAARTSDAETAKIELTFFLVHFCGLCMMSQASNATNCLVDQPHACDPASSTVSVTASLALKIKVFFDYDIV